MATPTATQSMQLAKTTPSPLETFPPEILEKICFFLDVRSLGRLACVCRRLSQGIRWMVIHCNEPDAESLQDSPWFSWHLPASSLRYIVSRSPHTLVLPLRSWQSPLDADMMSIVASCTSLRTLVIDFNRCGSQGIKVLADGLASMRHIQTLSLRCNKLGDEGATYLANALRRNQSIRQLLLFNNQIGPVGLAALCDAIAGNERSNIQVLGLRHNWIQGPGAATLAVLLRSSTKLTHVDVASNSIDSAGALALVDAVRSRPLRTLELWNNLFDADMITTRLRSMGMQPQEMVMLEPGAASMLQLD